MRTACPRQVGAGGYALAADRTEATSQFGRRHESPVTSPPGSTRNQRDGGPVEWRSRQTLRTVGVLASEAAPSIAGDFERWSRLRPVTGRAAPRGSTSFGLSRAPCPFRFRVGLRDRSPAPQSKLSKRVLTFLLRDTLRGNREGIAARSVSGPWYRCSREQRQRVLNDWTSPSVDASRRVGAGKLASGKCLKESGRFHIP